MSERLHEIFKRTQMLLGQVSGSTIEMPSLSVGAELRPDHPENEKAEQKRRRDFVQLIKLANAYIDQLERDIEDMEKRFRERDGDEWREQLVLKILDPDEIPQRREGESIEDYRKRLESILINKMLNPDGSIKKQYLDDPELREYAEWAQKKHHYNIARGYMSELENSNISLERAEEIYEYLKGNTDVEMMVFAERGAAPESDIEGKIKDIGDDNHDAGLQANNKDAIGDFLNLKT